MVQDRALLDQVALAWAPLERLGKEMEAHGEQKRHLRVAFDSGGLATKR